MPDSPTETKTQTTSTEHTTAVPVAPIPNAPVPTKEAEPDVSKDLEKIDNALNNQKNAAAEKKSLANRTIEDPNKRSPFKPTGSGSSYEMAMAGKAAMARLKEIKEERRQAMESMKTPPDKAGQQSSTPTQQQAPQVSGTDKLIELLEVMASNDPKESQEKIANWEKDHPGQRFDQAMLSAIDEYREETGKPYMNPDKDIPQDPLSQIESIAARSVVNEDNLATSKAYEQASKAAEEVKQAATSTQEAAQTPSAPK